MALSLPLKGTIYIDRAFFSNFFGTDKFWSTFTASFIIFDNSSSDFDFFTIYHSIIEKIISGEYAQKLKMDELCSDENSKRILASLAGEKVILFGMGIQGRTWLKTLIKNNKNIICLTDNKLT